VFSDNTRPCKEWGQRRPRKKISLHGYTTAGCPITHMSSGTPCTYMYRKYYITELCMMSQITALLFIQYTPSLYCYYYIEKKKSYVYFTYQQQHTCSQKNELKRKKHTILQNRIVVENLMSLKNKDEKCCQITIPASVFPCFCAADPSWLTSNITCLYNS
jgi:hypothetical protein